MKRHLISYYGDSLATAVEDALVERDRDVKMMAQLGTVPQYVFDFHGIETPVTMTTSRLELITTVDAELQRRAKMYDEFPVPKDVWEKEQGGKMGEYLADSVLPAIQRGMLWGNRVLQEKPGDFERLRHVFEFNGIKVPFNPWKEDEHLRVRREVEAQLNKR